MDTPEHGGTRLPEDVVVDTRYIYTLALGLVGLALATSVILFCLSTFEKALASREAELHSC